MCCLRLRFSLRRQARQHIFACASVSAARQDNTSSLALQSPPPRQTRQHIFACASVSAARQDNISSLALQSPPPAKTTHLRLLVSLRPCSRPRLCAATSPVSTCPLHPAPSGPVAVAGPRLRGAAGVRRDPDVELRCHGGLSGMVDHFQKCWPFPEMSNSSSAGVARSGL